MPFSRSPPLLPNSPPLQHFLNQLREVDTRAVNLFGPLPSKELLSKRPPPHPSLFIDGGIRHSSLLKKTTPSLFLGDGDSSCEKPHLSFPKEKDYSDLALGLAVLQLFTPPPQKLSLFGFLGHRRDHEWCSLLEVAHWLKDKVDTRALIDGEVELFSPGEFSLDFQGRFSLLTLSKEESRLEGKVLYPLSGGLAPLSSHGLSNRACGPFRWASRTVALFFWERRPSPQ